tara:strand:- start:4721 stop:5392 length:672 start_codon:yes stop_codon:yes gene_type:complete
MLNEIRQIIVLGDSGVYGWGDRESGGWCERLRQDWMSIPNSPILYSLGVRGDGLENVSKRWRNEWICRGELRRKVPNAILISVGLNDCARVGRIDGRPQLSTEGFRFGFNQLLREIRKETEVMVMGLTPVDEMSMPFSECLWYSNKTVSIYESQIEETCLELDIPFLPIYKELTREPNWLHCIEADGIHLNSDGHRWIYEKVRRWPYLMKWANLQCSNIATPI